MNRRDFAVLAAAAGAGTVLPRRLGAVNTGGSPARLGPLGVQLYTVRTLMARDFEGTIARVARVGYREVEFAGYFDRTPAQVRSVLRRNRLTAPSAHWPASTVDDADAWRRAIEAAAVIGHEYLTMAWVDESSRRTLDDWRRIADRFNHAAEEAGRSGIGFAYHNHSYEFEPLDGGIPYDVLLASTDPSLVKLEIDLYWLINAGRDPLDYFARWPGRVTMVHVKDMDAAHHMVDVGAGTIDWHAILSHHAEAGIRHYFVEHDEPADPIASITASYRYLSRLEV